MLTTQLGELFLLYLHIYKLVGHFVTTLNVFFLCGYSLLSIAKEALAEFLSKATGTAVDWVQMIGMKVIKQLFKFV